MKVRRRDGGITELFFRSAVEQDCQVQEATLMGDDVYAIVACPTQPPRLVRASRSAAPEAVPVPSLGRLTCAPLQVLAFAPDQLWLRAGCGGTPEHPEAQALFRQGHAQPPLKLP